ncbi:unnamed protein product [Rotaria magnacalcarata]|uniref:Peptidase S9 prolyl oligopeptidase catalytic domain-containing protein n=1 Tax=Rotaria magnacalcarata TaxID=392030 RepID=A0A816Q3C2_9BILA|nr:unnamed protein product [Rotaria magnacalcarata]CAF4685490.1 unnamed protein product [Rotaria magnacalcarata]
MKCYLLVLVLAYFHCFSTETLPKLTIDEFLNSTQYKSLSLSPDADYLLFHSLRPVWESDRYEDALWLHQTETRQKRLITNHLYPNIKPKWSPSGAWIYYLVDDRSQKNSVNVNERSRSSKNEKFIHLYNIISEETLLIEVGTQNPLAITWGDDDNSLYFISIASSKEDNKKNQKEWKDVVQYRQRKPADSTTLHRIDIKNKDHKIAVKITTITNIDFLVGELLSVPAENKLVFTSVSTLLENSHDFEIYALDLGNVSLISRLTDNKAIEQNLQLSPDGKRLFFQIIPVELTTGKHNATQNVLDSIDLTNGKTERWGKGFNGNIIGYTIRSKGGVYILGQLGVNVQIYVQQSSSKYLILQHGWEGTYQLISSATSPHSLSIAFIHSSFERALEVYFVKHTNQLDVAKAITCENQLLRERNLPRAKVYRWINSEDDRTIEGILHYPPGKFGCKNLPLFVLIHGGPNAASLNMLIGDWYSWAPLAATEGWLVLEPNYRGTGGYGDEFLSEIAGHPLSRPGRDILAGVDSLITDGIADPNRLTVGGYSYGGFLTNWLITQTTRFNAAVSGAGPVEHVSLWGLIDVPVYIASYIGGYPWEVPETYYKESIMFKLGDVQTPTLIVSGASDVRVPPSESLMLERGLNYLGVSAKLLLFPNEGHELSINPWHGKIKVREELEWLEKYGHASLNKTANYTRAI